MALHAGISVVPIRPDGTKQPALPSWREYQRRLPEDEEIKEWFAHPRRGLALVTGEISGGLIALDFDDPHTFEAWREHIRKSPRLFDLYRSIAQGYEEKTPKGGRHLLFRCPEVFDLERKPGNLKLALRPVPPPQRFETLIETREEGGIIIVYPSHGNVHPSGKPYYLLRGSITSIKTITAIEREQLYASVRELDEVPAPKRVEPDRMVPMPGTGKPTAPGERPGDLFTAESTWEQVLVGWDISEPKLNGSGYLERYLRHPGKVGPGPSCTLNADGSDRLFCFSPSVGLPMERYLNRFAFYAYWHWGGDFSQAARALAEIGYSRRSLSSL
jgi:putative DNA primase/helicase